MERKRHEAAPGGTGACQEGPASAGIHGNANVRASYQPESPGFLKMLKLTTDTARDHGKALTLCGEIAADPVLLPLLVGLGIENFSVGVHALPRVVESLSELAVQSCSLLAQNCLRASRTAEVREMLAGGRPQAVEAGLRLKGFETTDPVCGMVVETSGNPFTFIWANQKYLFCSRQCQKRFVSQCSRDESQGPV
jgi:YHS domain-containing protein